MATKAKRFRIAVEGATTDGRVISCSWISQMAKNYDPPMYGARVNMEHIKGYTPDSPFRRYGEESRLNSPPVLSDETHAIKKRPGAVFMHQVIIFYQDV